ncbi:MAG: hypoxanthine phosphoribosyltransferase [Chloroflexi bacterium RBG_13_54_9]|nr:MAG: hypoxanthine phosphoribosyltransferase [Chloroflexi bacterium RBG_13_54_9]
MQKLRVLIDKETIRKRVTGLADEIRADYAGRHPILVGVLKGSFVFMADLIRELNMPMEIDFIGLSSYGSGTESSGQVEIVGRLRCPIEGRDVLVVEDIADTGTSLSFLLDYLRKRNPSSLKVCALFNKPSRRKVPLTVDYLGFDIPDRFVVGYGLDFNEKYRYLPDLCVLEEESQGEP